MVLELPSLPLYLLPVLAAGIVIALRWLFEKHGSQASKTKKVFACCLLATALIPNSYAAGWTAAAVVGFVMLVRSVLADFQNIDMD